MRRVERRPLGALLSLLAVVFVAAGCGGGDDDKRTAGTTVELETLRPSELKVGSDIPYPPFEFGDAPDYKGFDVDVVNEVGKTLGLKARFVRTPIDTIFRRLVQGEFDMVGSASTITAEREKEVDFSDPYFPADQSLMVKKGSDIKTESDLDGKTVGAQLGTTGADYARKKTNARTVRTYKLIDEAFEALGGGEVDAVINDCPVSKYAEKAHPELQVVTALPTSERYGFAFPPDSDRLRAAFNEGLAEIESSGRLAEIQKKWLGTDPCKGLPGASR